MLASNWLQLVLVAVYLIWSESTVAIEFKQVIDHQQESFGGPAFACKSSIRWRIALGSGSLNSEAVHVQQP